MFVASETAVENAGRALAIRNQPTFKWEEAKPWEKVYYAQSALDALTKAAPHLVPGVLLYLIENHKAFRFSAHTVDQLMDAMSLARQSAETSHEGVLPHVG